MMILVDDAGGAWPGMNHSPWLGVTVADFVMPAFLFIIGVSAALVFKVYTPNPSALSCLPDAQTRILLLQEKALICSTPSVSDYKSS